MINILMELGYFVGIDINDQVVLKMRKKNVSYNSNVEDHLKEKKLENDDSQSHMNNSC